jgi:hypothetical protein
MARKCGSSDVPQPYGPLWPVTGIALALITNIPTQSLTYTEMKIHILRPIVIQL